MAFWFVINYKMHLTKRFYGIRFLSVPEQFGQIKLNVFVAQL